MSFKSSIKGLPQPRVSEVHPSLLNSSRSRPRSTSGGRNSKVHLPALCLHNKKFCMKEGKLCQVTAKPDSGKVGSRGRVALGKIGGGNRGKSVETSVSPVVKTSRSLKRVSFKAAIDPGKENQPLFRPKPKRSPSMPDKSFLLKCPAFVVCVENS